MWTASGCRGEGRRVGAGGRGYGTPGAARVPSRSSSAAVLTDALGVATPEDGPDKGTAVPLAGARLLRAFHQLPDQPDEFSGLEGLGEEGVDADVEAALDLVLCAGADDGEG